MEYKKDFDNWNLVKKEIDIRQSRLFFAEKDIWWCNIGINVGSEQDGKGGKFLRPVLIYKKINKRLFIGIPLTKILKEGTQHMSFYFDYNLHSLIISQIRTCDSKRLVDKMGSISLYLHDKTKKAVNHLLG